MMKTKVEDEKKVEKAPVREIKATRSAQWQAWRRKDHAALEKEAKDAERLATIVLTAMSVFTSVCLQTVLQTVNFDVGDETFIGSVADSSSISHRFQFSKLQNPDSHVMGIQLLFALYGSSLAMVLAVTVFTVRSNRSKVLISNAIVFAMYATFALVGGVIITTTRRLFLGRYALALAGIASSLLLLFLGLGLAFFKWPFVRSMSTKEILACLGALVGLAALGLAYLVYAFVPT